ncbi:S8 family serine peptidase [Microbacterium trichothecenolyticum]|uniref:LPXTG-motif cell wall-anchored protein n=1 Tax=Microbacterium trichothecenolyticum TaxID=69370 RepID=A0ABU0TUF9_MICTR|nr:S8 family serine peptidase [Microbacterium trichothecenolyticum]MDQ1122584.1 LPXTG-motif cell wall-anchored protein [Microbacterium trichothecenolyticum]
MKTRVKLTVRHGAVLGCAIVALCALPVSASAAPAAATVSLRADTAAGLTGSDAAPAESCRAIPVEADPVLRTDEARRVFGVDGTGVAVGVISNSFDRAPAARTTPQQDVEMGSLPGPGNPCGRVLPVRVLSDGEVGEATDEGRAMLQNVHGIAPGAQLLFAAGGPTSATMSEAIRSLQAAGADVIVDDVSYSTEMLYQRGPVASTIADVVAGGVVYVKSAGNNGSIGRAGGTSEGQSTGAWESLSFTGISCPQVVIDAIPSDPEEPGPGADEPGSESDVPECMDFDPEGSGSALLEATLSTFGPEADIHTSWSNPVGAVETLVIPLVFDADGALVSESGGLDPLLPVAAARIRTGAGAGEWKEATYRIALARSNPDSPDIRTRLVFTLNNGGVRSLQYANWPEGVTVGPAIYGPAADPAVIAVGSAALADPGRVKASSSPGPSTYLFGPVDPSGVPAPRLDAPQVYAKPDLIAVDGVRTSFLSPQRNEPDVFRFHGTSSAAPNAAAVAALALERAGIGTSPEVIRAALTSGARPLDGPLGYSGPADRNIVGSGLVDAMSTLAALPGPTPEPKPTQAPAAEPVPTLEPVPTDGPTASAAPSSPTPAAAARAGRLAKTGTDGTSALVLAFLGAAAIATGGVISVRRRARAQR